MSAKQFTKSTNDKMVFGVAAGMANYFNIDPTIMRLIFVAMLFTIDPFLIIYMLLAVLMPKDTAVTAYEKDPAAVA